MLAEIEITGYKPGALADVVRMHMAYYGPNWGFGLSFETKVAGELSEFLRRCNTDKDLFLVAYNSVGECVGSISLDCQDANGKGAHVRWFVVCEAYAGNGIGRLLLTKVTEHCDRALLHKSYLTTFEGLDAARKLYESFDYKLIDVKAVDQWSGGVCEQLFVRDLKT